MRLRRFGAKLSMITVGLLVTPLAGLAWVYGSLIIDTLAFGFDDQNKLSEVGFGATILFVCASAKFILIDCDGKYDWYSSHWITSNAAITRAPPSQSSAAPM